MLAAFHRLTLLSESADATLVPAQRQSLVQGTAELSPSLTQRPGIVGAFELREQVLIWVLELHRQ
ncbi:MAG: hypothetical protein RBU37_04030 [Myxococcota bacterium]|nr:hypothetical protein [Myxococcota bacterium]